MADAPGEPHHRRHRQILRRWSGKRDRRFHRAPDVAAGARHPDGPGAELRADDDPRSGHRCRPALLANGIAVLLAQRIVLAALPDQATTKDQVSPLSSCPGSAASTAENRDPNLNRED